MADEIITIDELLKRLDKYKHKELHIHHTWKPTHGGFNGKNGLQLNQSMRDYHMKPVKNGGRGFQDIAQHVTLLPDGLFVTGRSFSLDPASIKGKNSGAFMVEMIGNFDTKGTGYYNDQGYDVFGGKQKESMLKLAQYFDSKGKYIRFHRENDGKTCPGTSIDKEKFMAEVRSTVKIDSEFEQAIDILAKEFGIGEAYWKQKRDIDLYFPELMIKIASRYGDTKKAESAKYYIEGTTHVIELDPMMLRAKQVGKIDTFNGVNANFFDTSTGKPITIGWLASEGKILKDREQHKKWGGLYDYPKGTLIVFKDGTVQVGLMTDGQMDSIRDNIYFACQGFNLFPLDTAKEGYNLAEVGRTSNRVSIGYRKLDNKIILAVRANSDAHRARTTMTNLGCNSSAICLDSGGSTNLRVNGKDIFKTSRPLSNIIYW